MQTMTSNVGIEVVEVHAINIYWQIVLLSDVLIRLLVVCIELLYYCLLS